MNKIPESAELLSWKIHMARRNPSRAIAVAILILICSYFIFYTMEDFFFTFIATFVLIIMVLPYYLPTTYMLTEKGVRRKMLFSNQSRAWSEFNRYDSNKNTIKLYTMKQSSRLDNYRSFLLICNKNKEQVIEIIEKKLPYIENPDEK
ncbi:MAG: hypothetical protein U9O95_00195 [Candidatus Marinimicrobia bacterium]|nr:hypothetical protein [Candidatus Neomarinimicrobiota bacterium]